MEILIKNSAIKKQVVQYGRINVTDLSVIEKLMLADAERKIKAYFKKADF